MLLTSWDAVKVVHPAEARSGFSLEGLRNREIARTVIYKDALLTGLGRPPPAGAADWCSARESELQRCPKHKQPGRARIPSDGGLHIDLCPAGGRGNLLLPQPYRR